MCWSTDCDPDVFGQHDVSLDSRCNSTDEYSVQVNNGVICIMGIQPGSMAQYHCDSGYEPEPVDRAVYASSGEWSPSEVMCSLTGKPNCWYSPGSVKFCYHNINTLIQGTGIATRPNEAHGPVQN